MNKRQLAPTSGLSKLQRFIVEFAPKNGIVFADDVKAEFFGLPRRVVKRISSPQLFSRESIGADRYNAVSVSVSRAFTRLQQRGVLKRRLVDFEYVGHYAYVHKGSEIGWVLETDNSVRRADTFNRSASSETDNYRRSLPLFHRSGFRLRIKIREHWRDRITADGRAA